MIYRLFGALVVAVLLGCPPPPPPTTGPPEPAGHCPSAPPVMSKTQAARELARVARETRANLMARLEGSKGLFATLHTPQLALLEAALAHPSEAQRLDRDWMQDHLLRAYVEIHTREPLWIGRDGDVSQVVLVTGKDHRSAALHLTAQSDRDGWVYRFYFSPLSFVGDDERMSVEFHMPLKPGSKGGTARWRLSESSLSGLDRLPLLYLMSRVRAVRLGRWALLVGDQAGARQVLEEELACAPDLKSAEELLAATKQLPSPSDQKSRSIQVTAAPLKAPVRRELGHDPGRDLALRAAVLARLTPMTAAGLIGASDLKQAQEVLEKAAQALGKGDVGWGVASALGDFDRRLASMLSTALKGTGQRQETVASLVLTGINPPRPEDVSRELENRVLRANYGLVPRWVKGPKGFIGADGGMSRQHLLELRPVVQADVSVRQRAVAELRQRLGWGWIHPGLPPGSYSIRFVDHSAVHWREALTRIAASAGLESLKPLARRLLGREIHSPSEQAAGLAMVGLVQLGGEKALGQLIPLLGRGSTSRRATALRAMARVPDQRVAASLVKAAGSADPVLRAGAMHGLGIRGLPQEMRLLREGIKDANPRVSAAAMEGLLKARDPMGPVAARGWLTGGDRKRQELVLAVMARSERKLRTLGRELTKLVRRPAPSTRLPAALVATMGRKAVRSLTRLYQAGPGPMRLAVVTAATEGFGPLLRRAAKESDVELRRQAVLNLARLKRPPEQLLKTALKDPDPLVRLAAHAGLARLGRADSLLALGQGARGSCQARSVVLPTLCQSMDARSRGKLLVDVLQSGCQRLFPTTWKLALKYQADDVLVLRAALGHDLRTLRVQGALTVLGLNTGAARGEW